MLSCYNLDFSLFLHFLCHDLERCYGCDEQKTDKVGNPTGINEKKSARGAYNAEIPLHSVEHISLERCGDRKDTHKGGYDYKDDIECSDVADKQHCG